jgi:hypothetical protein
MKHGDGFAKKFGGPSGNDPDWYLLKVEGRNAANALVGQVEQYLADYRFANPLDDYILNAWDELDLTPLAELGVKQLAFRLSSSDNSIFGMNTPAYVAVDNLTLEVTSTPADFNLDNAVDGEDLAIWQQHYGDNFQGGVTTGDADDDGDVDGSDFLAWQRNFSPSQPLGMTVPEPKSAWLLFCWILHILITRKSTLCVTTPHE